MRSDQILTSDCLTRPPWPHGFQIKIINFCVHAMFWYSERMSELIIFTLWIESCTYMIRGREWWYCCSKRRDVQESALVKFNTRRQRGGAERDYLRVNAVPCSCLHYKACCPLSIITNNRMQMNPCSHHGLSMHGAEVAWGWVWHRPPPVSKQVLFYSNSLMD